MTDCFSASACQSPTLPETSGFVGIFRVGFRDESLEGCFVVRLEQRDDVLAVVVEVEPDDVELGAESGLDVVRVVEPRLE